MKTFEDFGLLPEILKAIGDMNFVSPTPIQEKVIPILLNSENDLIGLAQTGTGKTAAFGLPIIQSLDLTRKNPQAIIICPTRELCLQIDKDLNRFAKYMKKVSTVAVYGGVSIDNQIKKIEKGVNIVVATPGRMNDIIRRKKVNLNEINTVVLDEADEMLNMGFQEELNGILDETPRQKRTLLFSATMPKPVEKIAMKYLIDPITVEIGKRNIAADNINHYYYLVHEKDRYLALKRIVDSNPDVYGIVFCRTRMETKKVAENLIKDGYNADALHGDLSQAQRDFVMRRFRSKTLQLLVATDVAARGLDVNDLTHIINYNLPDDFEVYTHRSGRTARAGKSGVSIAIINLKEKWKIKKIEKIINRKFRLKKILSGKEICEKQFYALINKIKSMELDNQIIQPYLDKVYSELSDFTREEIIKRFVYLEFNRLLEYYLNDKDLNISTESVKDKKSDTQFKRYFLNLGSKDNLKPTDVIGFIIELTNNRKIKIGNIDIFKSFSFVDLKPNNDSLLTNPRKKITFNGHTVKFEEAKETMSKSKKQNRISKRKTRK